MGHRRWHLFLSKKMIPQTAEKWNDFREHLQDPPHMSWEKTMVVSGFDFPCNQSVGTLFQVGELLYSKPDLSWVDLISQSTTGWIHQQEQVDHGGSEPSDQGMRLAM